MNDYLWLALIELSALAIFETLLIAILLYRQHKINAVLQAAAEELRDTEEDRRRALTAILSGVHLLPEGISAELSTQLMQSERTLLRQCFDILLSHDPASAARLSDTVLAGLDDYLRKCAVPNLSRTVFPAPESVEEEVVTASSGEKLPYWMSKFEQEKFLPEGASEPEPPVSPDSFWPAAREAWSDAAPEEPPASEPEGAPAETALPVESEENIAASPVTELAESANPPVEIEPAEAPGETTLPTAAEDYTEQIGDLLDAYENNRDSAATPDLVVSESADAELPAQTATEPPSQQVATVDTLLAEFGITSAIAETPPLAKEEKPAGTAGFHGEAARQGERRDAASEKPAETAADKTPLEIDGPAPEAHPEDVEALLAEFGLTSSATPAPADEMGDKTPLQTVESAPAAHPDDVEALLTEFGFHSEPKPEIPDSASVANPEEVAALLAEFGLVPDGTAATDKPAGTAGLHGEAAPRVQRRDAASEPANVEPEQGATAATKRRGRRKSEAPE